MGLTYVDTNISSLDGSGTPFADAFLVDTGAIDSMVPAGKLRAAGIEPSKERTYELADGTKVDYAVGYAKVQFMDDETVTEVIFGPEDVEPILGAVALEMTGFIVDPRNNTLKRLPAISLK